MSRRPLLYIAGPYRGDVRRNTLGAVMWGQHFAKLGYHVLVPHVCSKDIDPFNRLGDQYWLDCTANMLRGCTHIVLTPGWERSAGSVNERRIAEEMGIEIWEIGVDTNIVECYSSLADIGSPA